MDRAIVTAAIVVSLSTASLSSPALAGKTADHIFVQPEEIDWQPAESIGDGAQMAVLEGDPKKAEPFTMRLKLEDGLRLMPHTHPEAERVTVLSGTLHLAQGSDFNRDQTQALKPGAIAIMPEGMQMYGYAEGETVVQLHGTGPWGITYLDPQDDPRNSN